MICMVHTFFRACVEGATQLKSLRQVKCDLRTLRFLIFCATEHKPETVTQVRFRWNLNGDSEARSESAGIFNMQFHADFDAGKMYWTGPVGIERWTLASFGL